MGVVERMQFIGSPTTLAHLDLLVLDREEQHDGEAADDDALKGRRSTQLSIFTLLSDMKREKQFVNGW